MDGLHKHTETETSHDKMKKEQGTKEKTGFKQNEDQVNIGAGETMGDQGRMV